MLDHYLLPQQEHNACLPWLGCPRGLQLASSSTPCTPSCCVLLRLHVAVFAVGPVCFCRVLRRAVQAPTGLSLSRCQQGSWRASCCHMLSTSCPQSVRALATALMKAGQQVCVCVCVSVHERPKQQPAGLLRMSQLEGVQVGLTCRQVQAVQMD